MKRIVFVVSVAAAAAGFLVTPADSSRAWAQRSATPTPTVTTAPTVSPSPKPTDDEVIKIDTELVNVTVRVIDRQNNRPVNGLLEKDFKVFEDGIPQQIDFFSQSEVPTNYGIVVDNSGSMRPLLDKVVEAGKVLVNTNRPGDETMIVRFVGRDKIEIEQPFTPKKEDLIDALDNLFIEGGQTAIIDAVYLAVENIDQYQRADKTGDKKRRALILVSDGEDRNSYYNEKQLFELLRESEVQIYVVGFVDELSKDGGFISKSPRDKAKEFLERIANETGGKAYFPKSAAELPGLAREISSELRTQYSIGYIPSNDKRDGTYRNIKVSVPEGPNGQKRVVIHRAGRMADGGPAATTGTPKPSPPRD